MDIFSEYRVKIIAVLNDLTCEGVLIKEISFENVIVEPPRDRSHGEFATNAALVVAKSAKKNPMIIAETISEILSKL